jgi:hypothetical protein
VALVGTVLAAGRLGGQEAAPAPAARWRATAEASANVLFGAARQRLGAATLAASRGGRLLAWRADAHAGYGDAAEDGDDGATARRVIARTARLGVSADWQPHGRVSPFALGALESSLQQRIARRVGGGAGVKYTLWRPSAPAVDGFAEDLSASLALLAERTRALPDAGATGGAGTRVRWSLRVRGRRRLASGVRLSHVTFWQPTVGQPSRYTVESTSLLAVPVRAGLELTGSLRDRYDSEARRRGARSNHDGQLLFGLRATFP